MQLSLAAFFRSLAVASIAAALVACGGGGGGGDAPGEQVGTVESFSIDSARAGAIYPIDVYLPESYATSRRTYPVIYAVEGDAPFGSVSSPGTRFETFKRVMQERRTQAILVGIGRTDRRNTDFLMPTAQQYHAFILQELVPRIDASYRADPTQRALSGLSHGGHFVFAALVMEAMAGDVRFSHFLSSEASSGGGQSTVMLEQQLADSGRPAPATLFLAGGATGTTNGTSVLALYERIRSRNYVGLTVEHMGFNTTHVGTDVPAFEEALRRYFP